MASNTEDIKPEDISEDESDPEDESTPADKKRLFVTEPGQICYDRVLPKDLNVQPRNAIPSLGGPGLLRASGVTRKLWHKRTLNVYFMEKSFREDEVMEYAKIWTQYCGIEFKKVDTPFGSDIRIGFNSDDGAWSYVGTDCLDIPLRELTMNLGFIDRATVLHEFGHTLGLIHEHQSPGKGNFKWNKPVVVKSLQGSPNYWSMETIQSNMFHKYKKSRVSGTKYDRRSIMHYSFPAKWIKGNKYPNGIPYNTKLSRNDQKLIRRFYGPPRKPLGDIAPPVATVDKTVSYLVPSVPALCEEQQLPDNTKLYSLPVFEPHKGVLKSSDDQLMVKFHTSTDDDPKLYTIVSTGQLDTLITLTGPDDMEKFVTTDDNGGDGLNAKIERVLVPDSDYYVKIRTFDPDGGEFKFFITTD